MLGLISLKIRVIFSNENYRAIRRGINFVGYRTWKKKKFIRKHSMYKFKKAIKKSKLESIISLIGHAKNTNSIPYFRNLLIEFKILNLLPKRSQEWLNI